MARHALTYLASGAVIATGLLFAGVGYAQSDQSPAKSNCDTKTGCANYETGNVTNQNPMQKEQQQSNAPSPYDNGPSPAKSNCDTPTGCANYETGDQTKTNPAQPMQQQQKK
jgi:hypothetical protein